MGAELPHVRPEILDHSKVIPHNHLQGIFPARPTEFKESAVKVPNDSHLSIITVEYPYSTTVQGKKISLKFLQDRDRVDNRVLIIGAKEIRVFTPLGDRFKDQPVAQFEMPFLRKFTTRTRQMPKGHIYVVSGDIFFLIDQKSLIVKVWTPECGFEAKGFLYRCPAEPRPEIDFDQGLLPIEL